jgi:hypothetical protein
LKQELAGKASINFRNLKYYLHPSSIQNKMYLKSVAVLIAVYSAPLRVFEPGQHSQFSVVEFDVLLIPFPGYFQQQR